MGFCGNTVTGVLSDCAGLDTARLSNAPVSCLEDLTIVGSVATVYPRNGCLYVVARTYKEDIDRFYWVYRSHSFPVDITSVPQGRAHRVRPLFELDVA